LVAEKYGIPHMIRHRI